MFGSVLKHASPTMEAIEKLSKGQRIVISTGAFVVLIGFFIWFSFYPNFIEIDRLKKEIDDLKAKLTIAAQKARQLPRYREMMKQAEADFMIAKRALPEKKEIPSLLTAISRAGRDVGLDFILFQPGAEVKKDFYAEIPVSIKVMGSYHNIAMFFDKVARLFRVVNLTGINLTARQGIRNLDTSCTAVTYRFIEPPQQKAVPKKEK
jgi:type IV pilus assembly protein PilO